MRKCFAIVLMLLFGLLLLNGCGSFFSKDGTGGSFFSPDPGNGTGGTGGGGTAAVNDLFVANSGANSVTGLGISATGTLAALNGSPINFSIPPIALAVSRDNRFLWVGTPSQIYGFSIATDGTLAALNGGNAIAQVFCADLQTSPDGKWLMVLDGSGDAVDLFSIASDGTLTPGPNNGIEFQPTGTPLPRQLRISSAGNVVIAAMGTAGELVFSFDTNSGVLQLLNQVMPPNNLTSDNAIAIDSTGTYLYEARSGTGGGLVVNTIGSNGSLTPTTSTSYVTGAQPYAVLLDNTGKFVYVANRGDSTISGWSVGTNAALTALKGSPFASGSAVTSLGEDSTGKYLAAAAFGGSPDLTLYSFSTATPGALVSAGTSATGTNASVVAFSH